MRLAMRAAVAGWAAVVGLGCGATFTDPLGHENAFDESQRRYTQLVRWGEMERASAFVDPDLREDFLVFGPQLENVRISDFEIGEVTYEDEKASVTVTYRAYSRRTATELPIREKQEWFLESGGVTPTWYVRSELPQQISDMEVPAR